MSYSMPDMAAGGKAAIAPRADRTADQPSLARRMQSAPERAASLGCGFAAGVAGCGHGFGVYVGGEVLEVLHTGGGGGEGELAFDDEEVGLPHEFGAGGRAGKDAGVESEQAHTVSMVLVSVAAIPVVRFLGAV